MVDRFITELKNVLEFEMHSATSAPWTEIWHFVISKMDFSSVSSLTILGLMQPFYLGKYCLLVYGVLLAGKAVTYSEQGVLEVLGW